MMTPTGGDIVTDLKLRLEMHGNRVHHLWRNQRNI
jgi:hypothetical protein